MRPPSTLSDLLTVARAFDTGMLFSTLPDGLVRSRPMAIARVDDEGTFWFLTEEDAVLLDDVRQNDRVSLACMAGSRFLHVAGRLRAVRDKDLAQAVWSPRLRPWAPGGPEATVTVVLELRPEHADFWDVPAKLRLALDRAVGIAHPTLREGHVTFGPPSSATSGDRA